ncbi:RNA polymerase sigma factor [Desulfatirhabdium butyrativorans]|uniref:RNA polymerase sigma factor n=1 Tax=Desulfatirhabdium butyrativorans TaxID=340467 RepID=UPI000424E212|nr:RNA polymerase sigma factor [Desulfatirhabdium butyrativorans]
MTDLETYYRTSRDRLYGYLLRLCANADLAADLTQDAFLRYASRYGVDRIEPALLYRIARNLMIDAFRKRKPDTSLTELLIDERNDPEMDATVHSEFRRTLEALQQMKAEDREILALVSGDDELGYGDIARILGISEGNVRIRVHRARMRLREALK